MFRNQIRIKPVVCAIIWGLCGGAWFIVWATNVNSTHISFSNTGSKEIVTLDQNHPIYLQFQSRSQFFTSQKCIDLNKATTEELATLPGIGDVIAERIIKFREKQGNFKKIEDLDQINGIGKAKISRLQEKVCL